MKMKPWERIVTYVLAALLLLAFMRLVEWKSWMAGEILKLKTEAGLARIIETDAIAIYQADAVYGEMAYLYFKTYRYWEA